MLQQCTNLFNLCIYFFTLFQHCVNIVSTLFLHYKVLTLFQHYCYSHFSVEIMYKQCTNNVSQCTNNVTQCANDVYIVYKQCTISEMFLLYLQLTKTISVQIMYERCANNVRSVYK